MVTPTPAPDLIAALRSLTAAELRDRLHALDVERTSIVALLRSVSARERAAARRATRLAAPEEVRDA